MHMRMPGKCTPPGVKYRQNSKTSIEPILGERKIRDGVITSPNSPFFIFLGFITSLELEHWGRILFDIFAAFL